MTALQPRQPGGSSKGGRWLGKPVPKVPQVATGDPMRGIGTATVPYSIARPAPDFEPCPADGNWWQRFIHDRRHARFCRRWADQETRRLMAQRYEEDRRVEDCLVSGDPESMAECEQALMDACQAGNLKITAHPGAFVDQPGCIALIRSHRNHIEIAANVHRGDRICAIAHELGHHFDPGDKGRWFKGDDHTPHPDRKPEAEIVANWVSWAICDWFGLDMNDRGYLYQRGWLLGMNEPGAWQWKIGQAEAPEVLLLRAEMSAALILRDRIAPDEMVRLGNRYRAAYRRPPPPEFSAATYGLAASAADISARS